MGPANLPHGTHRVQSFEMKVRDICQLQLNFKTHVQSLSRSFLKLPWSSSCQSSEQGKSIHQKKFSKDFGLRAVRLVSGVVVQVLGFKHEIRLTGHNFHSASKETISAGRPVSIYVQIDFINGCKNCMNILRGICLSTAFRTSFEDYVDWMVNLSHSLRFWLTGCSSGLGVVPPKNIFP